MKVTAAQREEQAAYYRLCDEARELGIPTSLDDPRSPKTVDELRGAVARATTPCPCGAEIGADGENGPVCDAGHDVWLISRERMNDYVGPPIMATVTWDDACKDGERHHLGLMSHNCLRCGARATVIYDNAR